MPYLYTIKYGFRKLLHSDDCDIRHVHDLVEFGLPRHSFSEVVELT
jgi:hypothetical protein